MLNQCQLTTVVDMVTKEYLYELYLNCGLSMRQIADKLGCSIHKVQYWMQKHGIDRRSRSDASYLHSNPEGDPFKVAYIQTIDDAYLYGLGIGLYWGEGTKANTQSVRLGNSDPELIKAFMEFLIKLYGVNRSDLRFGLQLFTDIKPENALSFWTEKLGIIIEQFYKPHITRSIRKGTYRHKSQHGVVTVYYNNKKLRDILVNALPR